jgi:tungstate transport system substrate-binding protein
VRQRALALLLALCAACAPPRSGTIVVATTTSVMGSGMLDKLGPLYHVERQVTVNAVPVGSGRALKMLEQQQADAAITHAPAQETGMLRAHPAWSYRKVLFNRFLIVGPPDDPASARSAPGAVEAMRRIARAEARFDSRGDESGTHERERQLWAAAEATPAPGRLVIAGAGMSETLRIASETRSYTLTDENTMTRLAKQLDLRIVSEGDPILLNSYAVVADRGNRGGAAFADWFADAGRAHLARLIGRGALPGFTLWPAGRPSSSPADLPF